MVHETQSANEQYECIEHRNPAAPVEMCQRTLCALFLNSCIHTFCAVFDSTFFFPPLLCSFAETFFNSHFKPHAGLMMQSVQVCSAPCSSLFQNMPFICYLRIASCSFIKQ